MDDFIFGFVAVDELKLNYHRLTCSGLQHNHERSPRDPEPGRDVRLQVRIAPDVPVDHVAAYVTIDGSIPEGHRGEARNGFAVRFSRLQPEWDRVIWGYLSRWEAVLPGQPEGTVVRYRIGGWRAGGQEVFADWPDIKLSTDFMAAAYYHDRSLQPVSLGDATRGDLFSFHVDRLKPPAWARASVIYHIFVDRFFPGQGREWLQTSDLRAPFGGTLVGITEKLDYLQNLGCTCLWLSPVFPSPTVHGYDAVDTSRVEERLGGDAALRTLVDEAHTRGIRVVLDLVCNHISNQHPIFIDAWKNERSPYRSWFYFDDSAIGYRTFFGVRTMPQLNLAEDGARAWMMDTARYWLREFDVDGYRLDHANGPGPGFWSDFWSACKAEKPDSFCFGEMVEPADVIRRYSGSMDGALDFHFADAVRRTYAKRSWSEAEMLNFLSNHRMYFEPDFLMLTFLDNHDMDRFLFLAEGDRAKLREALEVQMGLPGPPVIYYGSEVGLSRQGGKSREIGLEASRTEMIWGEAQDAELLAFYQQLIHERKENRPWER